MSVRFLWLGDDGKNCLGSCASAKTAFGPPAHLTAQLRPDLSAIVTTQPSLKRQDATLLKRSPCDGGCNWLSGSGFSRFSATCYETYETKTCQQHLVGFGLRNRGSGDTHIVSHENWPVVSARGWGRVVVNHDAIEALRGVEAQRRGGPRAWRICRGNVCPHKGAVHVCRHPHLCRRVSCIFLRRVKDGEIGERL